MLWRGLVFAWRGLVGLRRWLLRSLRLFPLAFDHDARHLPGAFKFWVIALWLRAVASSYGTLHEGIADLHRRKSAIPFRLGVPFSGVPCVEKKEKKRQKDIFF